ncbi:MAG: hypothetical protein N3A55_00835 [Methylohalobius sp.]|nr:hypothetical protein [Methylohalobius sp.]
MRKVRFSKGVVLATTVAAIFSAGCTAKEPQPNKAEAQSPEEQPLETLEWSIQPVDETEEKAKESAKEQGALPTTPGIDQPTEAKVACFGINACKGQSDCATPRNACKGMNSCKGQGFKYVTLKECEAQGGKVGQPSM